jgi:hypothetical protein
MVIIVKILIISSLASIVLILIVLLCLFNYKKVSWSLGYKVLMGGSSLVFNGGFDGISDSDSDCQAESSKGKGLLNSNLINIRGIEMEIHNFRRSATDMGSPIEKYNISGSNSSGSFTEVKYEGKGKGKAVSVPINKDFSSSSRSQDFKNVMGVGSSSRSQDFKNVMGVGNSGPWDSKPSPAREIPNRSLRPGDRDTWYTNKSTSENSPAREIPNRSISSGDNGSLYRSDLPINKRVRFRSYISVFEIERVEVEVEAKIEKPKKLNISSKSSYSEASPDVLSHGQPQINNPASNRDMPSLLKDFFKKEK